MHKQAGVVLAAEIAAFLVILLTGCGSAISALSAIVAASEALLPVLEATGTVPPGTAVLIEKYLGDVQQAVDKADVILVSNESAAQKALDIAAAFAGIAAPDLPAGTAQTVVALVDGVIKAVRVFLSDFPAPTGPQLARSKPSKLPAQMLDALASIRGRNSQVGVRLKALTSK